MADTKVLEIAPRVEDEGDDEAVDDLTDLKLALGNRVHRSTNVIPEEGDGTATVNRSGVMVTHQRSRRVRLYKGTATRPVCRLVPAANGHMERLLDPEDGGWSIHCPKCHTDCGGAVWGCGKDPEPKFYQCPVPNCNMETGGPKKFYEVDFTATVNTDPNHLVDPDLTSAMSMARTALRSHLRSFHPDVADAMGIPK